MHTLIQPELIESSLNVTVLNPSDHSRLQESIAQAWQTIAPFWPLKNLIACNPLQGLEDLPFEQALAQGAALFQQAELPQPMETINRETIKWCEVFFDEGQATIPMPGRHLGFYRSWLNLAPFDHRLHHNNPNHIAWLERLPQSAEQTIKICLGKLHIPTEEQSLFLRLLLTTLPGWAGYIKYRTQWNPDEARHPHPVSPEEYLAVRLAITCLLWPEASHLSGWYQAAQPGGQLVASVLTTIETAEKRYRWPLLGALSEQAWRLTQHRPNPVADAQLVFCIDVRSEPFRRSIEAQGNYETLGFAGFFGLPIALENEMTGEAFPSCPVLLTPKHTVKEAPVCRDTIYHQNERGKHLLSRIKRFYQALKYSFTTPFALVETLGPWSGLWMGLRTLAPRHTTRLKHAATQAIRPDVLTRPVLTQDQTSAGIALADQCAYAEGALRMMGLTTNFAPLVVFCGHGSTTQNNAYATALDCGACGGHHGGSNAQVLAAILNQQSVRAHLARRGLHIPDTTWFLGAEHNTTTDEITLRPHGIRDSIVLAKITNLEQDLAVARGVNSRRRCEQLGVRGTEAACINQTALRSTDWAQTRPEWGLARNAAFIVAPRHLTRDINLEGRSFLHSYDWQQDLTGSSLTTILTAPMVVAQWINNQYLFSTLDNVAFGSGSKVTHNITGKIGVMQGNASDLMHGLPLQSIFRSDTEPYHQPLRLMTVVYAPKEFILNIVKQQEVLRKLLGNGWVTLACIHPEDQQPYVLDRDLTWHKAV